MQLTLAASSDLREILVEASTNSAIRVEAAILLAMPLQDGTRPVWPDTGGSDRLITARSDILAGISKGEGDAARWQGYLALIADALGERETFRRLYTVYLDLPRRPPTMDKLLAEIAAPR